MSHFLSRHFQMTFHLSLSHATWLVMIDLHSWDRSLLFPFPCAYTVLYFDYCDLEMNSGHVDTVLSLFLFLSLSLSLSLYTCVRTCVRRICAGLCLWPWVRKCALSISLGPSGMLWPAEQKLLMETSSWRMQQQPKYICQLLHEITIACLNLKRTTRTGPHFMLYHQVGNAGNLIRGHNSTVLRLCNTIN